MTELTIQAALAGPALAGLVWLALGRWPWPRRVGGGLVGLAAHGAAWWVFWSAYHGDAPSWRAFQPTLLGATVAAVAEIALILTFLRAERLDRGTPAVVLGLAASASAIVASAYTTSVIVVALSVPIPTVAAWSAVLAGGGVRDGRGLFGLALADGLALAGLSILYARAETTVIGPATGLGVGLVLAAAAAKAGAIPGVATWTLTAGGGPAGLAASAVRAQGVALAALAGVEIALGRDLLPAAITAGVVALLGGWFALGSRSPDAVLACSFGAAASVLFVAIGLGGTLGVRSFLLLFPAFLLASATLGLAAGERRTTLPRRGPRFSGTPVPRPGRTWRALGSLGAGVALISLLGLPPGGGFPGTWLSLSVAGARGEVSPGYLVLAAAVALGLVLAFLAAIPLIRAEGAGRWGAIVAAVAGTALLYLGVEPVRLGVGWWIRAEQELGMATVLGSAGAPMLPPLGGLDLLVAAAPALVLVGAVVALGGGLRAHPARSGSPFPRRDAHPGRAMRWAEAVRSWRERPVIRSVALWTAVVLEAAAIALTIRLVVLAARAGFL